MVSNSVGLIFGTCRCSTDEQSITYNNEVIVGKKVRVSLFSLVADNLCQVSRIIYKI